MILPTSKTLTILLITCLAIMILLSILGSLYEKDLLALKSKVILATYSKLIFLFLGSLLSISAVILFTRYFLQYAEKIISLENPAFAQKINGMIVSGFFETIALSLSIIIAIGSSYIAYKILSELT